MPFALESEMVRPVQRWLSADGFQVRLEFALPWGVCDIVAARLDQERVRQRRDLGQRAPIGPPLRIDILMRIPPESEGRSIRLRTLARQYASGLDETVITAQLENLVSRRFVRRTRHGLQRLISWYPMHERLVAVELKRSRVREALRQARHHQRFATDAYVGLPVDVARRLVASPRRKEFEESGIGVLGISQGKCRVLLQPACPKDPQDHILQAHTTERFWRRSLKDN